MYDNLITSDHLEQVVQKIQNTKASKSTTLSGYGITDSYTKTETDNRIQDIVGAAPEALDTLEEIAEALQDGESTAAGLVQTLSQKADKSTTVTNIAYGSKKITKTINGSTTDVVTINAIKSDLALTKSDVGLSNVDNTSDANKPVSNATQTALDTKVDKVSGKGLSTNDYTTAEKNKLSDLPTATTITAGFNLKVDKVNGMGLSHNDYTTEEKQKLASGVAELDSNGKVLSSQLPSYVDDVLEYTSLANFPTTGESGKIYVDTNANLTYRWTGSAYREISPSLALGETSSTAYRGDRGKVAYTHATDSNRLTTAKTSGLYKISTTAEGHVASAETATKSDIGLGNVDNTSDLDKPISTATQEALNTKVNITTSVLKSDEEFTYRQTGDGSLDIDAKYGKLKSIKGRTLVWNQQVTNGNFANGDVAWYFVNGGTHTVTNGVVSYSWSSSYTRQGIENQFCVITASHKYYIAGTIKNLAVERRHYYIGQTYAAAYADDIFEASERKRISNVVTATSASGSPGYYLAIFGPVNVNNSVEATDIVCIDLTLMFGAGNEPATAAEFEALYPLPYYAYNIGELINNGLQSEYDLVWNQLIANGNFSNGTTGWSAYNSTLSAASGELTITKSNTASGLGGLARTTLTGDTSHWYYIACDAKSDSANTEMYFGFHTTSNTIGSNIMVANGTSTYRRISIITRPNNATDSLCARIGIGASAVGVSGKIKNVIMCDLTFMFGAGNEPASPEEFEAMFPADYYAYDTGTQGHYSFPQFKTKIETVGWNLVDIDSIFSGISGWQNLGGGEWYVPAGKANSGTNVWENIFGYTGQVHIHYEKKAITGTNGERFQIYYKDGSYEAWNPSTVLNTYQTGNFLSNRSKIVDFIMLSFGSGAHDCYLKNICISLSDQSRNGTYEPYWRSDLELGLGDIKVKSHNIWDEEWEAGTIAGADGQNSSGSAVRSKGYIQVEPSTTYYNKGPLVLFYYDSSKNFISYSSGYSNNAFTTPSNCHYLRFATSAASSYGTTYQNDICINLSDPAFNGRYEPYGDGGVISITGGLKSAGTAYDEISGGKYIKRVGSVDMGDLSYLYRTEVTGGGVFSSTSIADKANGVSDQMYANIVCPMYMTAKSTTGVTLVRDRDNMTICDYAGASNIIYVKNLSYTEATAFKEAMAGVLLYYELAQPIEYELYNPIDLSYKVDKFGTEKLLPGSTSAIVSSPFRADIEYRTTNVTIDDVYGGSDIIKSVEDVDSRLTTIEKSINGLVTIGSGIPTTIPKNIGDFYIDVTNKILYFATGNQLISDWNS